MQIIKKAFIVWHEGMLSDFPHDGYRLEEIDPVYAETPNKAKSKAWFDLEGYNMPNGEPHGYTDIKVRRKKSHDIVLYKGEKRKRYWVIEDQEEEKRKEEFLKKLEAYPDNSHFYVQKGYVGNSCLWWGLRSCGYTTDIQKAELFTKAEIKKGFINKSDENVIWESSHVLENRSYHVDSQNLNHKNCIR